MEKGYRDFGHDIDNTDNVIEAGLGFAVDLDKPAFVGREAVVAIKAAGVPHRRLVQVRLTDPDPMLHHGELVMRDGEVVGYVRAASYGWTLGGAVGLAMLDAGEPLTADWIKAGTWTVDVAGTAYDAVVSLRPMYDPTQRTDQGLTPSRRMRSQSPITRYAESARVVVGQPCRPTGRRDALGWLSDCADSAWISGRSAPTRVTSGASGCRRRRGRWRRSCRCW